jgi:hypothetical protein
MTCNRSASWPPPRVRYWPKAPPICLHYALCAHGTWYCAADWPPCFLFTGLAHFDAFGMRADLVAMVRSAFPAPGLLVTFTGILELAGALGIRKVSMTS